jgi:hypothetical protein
MSEPRTAEEKAIMQRRLKGWRVDAMGMHPGGSNYVFVLRLKPPEKTRPEDADADPILAIYKPVAGERPLHDFPYGTLHRRERAAFLVSEALGWPLIPPVVIREGPHGVGSVQLFIDHDPHKNFFNMRDDCLPMFAPVAAFDVLVHNADRKGGAVLVGRDGRLWAIDNALTFNPYARRRTVMFEFSQDPYPAGVVGAVEALLPKLEKGQPLGDELADLLLPNEISALRERAEAMIRSGVHPRLHPELNAPWPFV